MASLFLPQYVLTPKILSCLLRIEAVTVQVVYLPVTPAVLESLRETAKLLTTHYSTFIEGNRLDSHEIEAVIKNNRQFPGRERDMREVQNYYEALAFIEAGVREKKVINEFFIKRIHACVMGKGTVQKLVDSPYRDGQNVIRDMATQSIVYLPPEAKDVPLLMGDLVQWINHSTELPAPLVAAIAHYQYATIHPYYDGNGRTARLLTSFILHQRGYGLKGLYSLEEYYARDLAAYYNALSRGPSHNYYMGRAEADITPWIEYFIEGMAYAFESVVKKMQETQTRGRGDQSDVFRYLDPRQKKVLALFETQAYVTAKNVSEFLGISSYMATYLCQRWVKQGFFVVQNPSNKMRSYSLAAQYDTRV